MLRVWMCIAVAGALAAPAVAQSGGGLRPREPAATFMTAIVQEKLANQYDVAWKTLYPPHQRVAPLDAYVACESLTPPAGTLVAVKVVRVFDQRIAVSGATGKLMTRGVRVRVTVLSPAFPLYPVSISQTFHALAVDGHWRWILSTGQYAYYSAGSCPYF